MRVCSIVDCYLSAQTIRVTFISCPLQKVFPEAVKAGNQDPTSEISSDDSEDEDFDPDRPQADGKVSRNESSSDESEYATASDNSAPQLKDNQYLGLPSDDSEDDNYDPDAPNPDAVKEESSSSDFTSDSEDLEAALVYETQGSKGVPESSSTSGRSSPKRKSSGTGGMKQATDGQLQSLSESEPGESGATPASARRIVERFDYKQLHDVSLLSHFYILYYHFLLLLRSPVLMVFILEYYI